MTPHPKPSSLKRILARLMSLADQGFFSVAGFILTIAFAHLLPPHDLAGYGVSLAIAVFISSAYRSAFVIPISLMSERMFRIRQRGLVGQHLIFNIVTLALALAGAALGLLLPVSPLVQAILVSLAAAFSTYMTIDFDRLLLIRTGSPRHSAITQGLYCALCAALALAIKYLGLDFAAAMAIITAFGIARTAYVALRAGGPHLRHGRLLIRRAVRTNLGWTAIGTLAAAGYAHIPLFALSLYAPALSVAAYTATRSPIQPLQIITRSLDVIDKLNYGRIPKENWQRRRAFFLRTFARYVALGLVFAVGVGLAAEQVNHFLLGPRYTGFGWTLREWCLVFIFMTSSVTFETVLFSEGLYKPYALMQITGGVVAALASIPLSMLYHDVGAVGACLIGWMVSYSGSALLVRNCLRARA